MKNENRMYDWTTSESVDMLVNLINAYECLPFELFTW